MKWEKYYEKFYDLDESINISRISSLTDFESTEEIIEIVENFDDKNASKLINRALSEGVYFDANDVVNVSEFLDKQTLTTLIKQCEERFWDEQIEHLISCTAMFEDEVLSALNYISLYPMSDDDNLTWKNFFENFDGLNQKQVTLALQKLDNFGNQDEIVEIAFLLNDNERYDFIKKALSQKVKFSSDNIDMLSYGDKRMSALLKSHKNYVPTKRKLGFWGSLGLALLGTEILGHIFGDKED